MGIVVWYLVSAACTHVYVCQGKAKAESREGFHSQHLQPSHISKCNENSNFNLIFFFFLSKGGMCSMNLISLYDNHLAHKSGSWPCIYISYSLIL